MWGKSALVYLMPLPVKNLRRAELLVTLWRAIDQCAEAAGIVPRVGRSSKTKIWSTLWRKSATIPQMMIPLASEGA